MKRADWKAAMSALKLSHDVWVMRFFVWDASPVVPKPLPLSAHETTLLNNVDRGILDGVPALSSLGEEIRVAMAHRDALLAWTPSPFVSQPDIPVDGTADGLAWGRCEVSERAVVWCARMTVELPRVRGLADEAPMLEETPSAVFKRHRFRSDLVVNGIDIFVRDGIDVERVAMMLPEILR